MFIYLLVLIVGFALGLFCAEWVDFGVVLGWIFTPFVFLFCCVWHPVRYLFRAVPKARFDTAFAGLSPKIFHVCGAVYLVIDKSATKIFNKIFLIRFKKPLDN